MLGRYPKSPFSDRNLAQVTGPELKDWFKSAVQDSKTVLKPNQSLVTSGECGEIMDELVMQALIYEAVTR